MARPLAVAWLGRAPYRRVWALQEAARDRILAGAADEVLILCEHEPVITLGRSADPRHVLAVPEGVEQVRTSRGGDVTVHGPGQLVIYPVVRLDHGVLAFVESVGRAIAAELVEGCGVAAEWRRAPAGVWLVRSSEASSGPGLAARSAGEPPAKLAACGVHVKRRVAIHGFALNVTRESAWLFERIVPCGLAGSLPAFLGDHAPAPALPVLAERLAARIAAALARDPRPAPSEFCSSASIVSCDQVQSR